MGGILSFSSLTATHLNSIKNDVALYFPQFLESLDSLTQGSDELGAAADGAQSSADSLGSLGDSIHANEPVIDTNMVISPGVIPSDGSSGFITNLFDLFWSNGIILSMITTVAAIATISYVFFGRKTG